MNDSKKNILREKFWEKYTLDEMNHAEWEALCDGCGKCCLIKFESEGKVYLTNIACTQIDLNNCKCKNYKNRTNLVKDCISLTKENLVDNMNWLPYTCSYRLVHERNPLPTWHHLISKDKKKVHKMNLSIKNNSFHESQVKEKSLVSHIIAEIEN